jgi:hypothetical protein
VGVWSTPFAERQGGSSGLKRLGKANSRRHTLIEGLDLSA